MSSLLITNSKEIGMMAVMREMRDHKVSQVVVIEGDDAIGIIAERDVIRAVSIASLAPFAPLTRP